MLVDVSELRKAVGNEARHQFCEPLEPVPHPGGLVTFPEPARVSLRLINTGRTILAHVRAQVVAELECARCLERFRTPVEVDYEEEYREGRPPAPVPGGPRETALTGEDLRTVFFEGDFVDFGPDVRENLALALPMKPVCREECRGLCPRCGRNLNRGPCGCPPEPAGTALERLAGLWAEREEEEEGGAS
ncbi:MAG: DUF177 domain-containing protein [Acetobacteraceae bacterium]|nr:DUF177 domain-containing protein [Acetobacteraceae bacterium]